MPRRRSLHRKSRRASNICVGVSARSFSPSLLDVSSVDDPSSCARFLPSLSRSLTRDFRPSSHGSSSTIRPVNSSRRRGTRYNVSHIPGCWCSAVPDLSGRWAARKSVSSTAGRSFHLIRASLLSNQHQRTSIVADVHRTSFAPVPSNSRRRWSDRTKGFCSTRWLSGARASWKRMIFGDR